MWFERGARGARNLIIEISLMRTPTISFGPISFLETERFIPRNPTYALCPHPNSFHQQKSNISIENVQYLQSRIN